jgi:AraC-like DNA-binding protein
MIRSSDVQFHRFGRGTWLVPTTAGARHGTVVIVTERGTARLAGQDTVAMESGEVVVAPAGRFTSLSVDAQSGVAVAVLAGVAAGLDAGATLLRIRPEAGSTASVLRYVVLGLSTDSSTGAAPGSPRVVQQLSAIVMATCAEHVSAQAYSAGHLFEDARAHIESRLADRDLGLENVARALNVSTRTLNRAFRSHDLTFGEWIRRRRLDQCRIDLEDPMLAHVPVSVLAARWGLTDPAHFSRIFKTEYGTSPRSFRSQHRPATTPVRFRDELAVAV